MSRTDRRVGAVAVAVRLTSVWPQKRQPALVLGVLDSLDHDAARVLSSDSASVVPPARSLMNLTVRGGGGNPAAAQGGRRRTITKEAQRTGKVAGARPDDARWRSCRCLEQFSVNVHYREELFSVVSIERSRPSEENVVTVPVGCLEYSEPAQGELGRRTETRLGLGGRLASPIPDRPMSVGAALGRRWTDRQSQTHGRRTRIRGSTGPHRHGCTR